MNIPPEFKDDEIDIFDLVRVIWSERAVLLAFLAIAALGGGLYSLNFKPNYLIGTDFTIDAKPPFRSVEEIHGEINKHFFDEDTFSVWKKNNTNSELNFALIQDLNIIDDVGYYREVEDKFIVILPDKILVKTGDVQLVLEVLKFLGFVGDKISAHHEAHAKKQLDMLAQLRKNSSLERIMAEELTLYDRTMALEEYMDYILSGRNLLSFSGPKIPTSTSPPRQLIFTMALIVGGIFGVIFILFRSAFQKRKAVVEQATE